jgi:hypothetical protein
VLFIKRKKINADLLQTLFIRDGYYAYLLKQKHPEIKYIVTAQGSDITHAPFSSDRVKLITLDVLHNT